MKTKRIRSLLILSFIICHMSFSPAWAQGNPYGIYPVPHLTQVTDQTAAVTEAPSARVTSQTSTPQVPSS